MDETSIEHLPQPGVILDTRSEAEKKKDYHISEIVSAIAPVAWTEKPQTEWRKFPISSQNGSASCVAQTLRKLYGVYIYTKTGFYVDLSASHIYQRRANKPSGGMQGVDAFTIAQSGTTLEQFAPSENMTDSQMDAVYVLPFMEKVGETFKLGQYVTVSPTDIDTIASLIQVTKKAVMVWFYFTYDEWGNVPVILHPTLDRLAPSTIRHSVAAVDFTLYNGKKALIIDDSWGLMTAMNGQRVITEDFFKTRNFFAAHFQNFAFEQVTTTPHYDGSIVSLQDCLKAEGLFPTNVASSGVYGPVTTTAVKAFQAKYGIQQVGTVGPLTRAKLIQLYP